MIEEKRCNHLFTIKAFTLKKNESAYFEKRKSRCLHFCSLAQLTASELTGRRWMFSRSGLSVTGGFIRLSTCFQSVEVVTLSRRLTVLSRSRRPPLPAGVHWRRSYSKNRQMPKKEKAVSYWSSSFLLHHSLTSSHWCFYIYI